MLTRRSLLGSLPAVLALSRGYYAHGAGPRMRLLIGTGTSGSSTSKGIYLADWNSNTGEIGEPSLAASLESPTFLALSPRTHRLYATSETRNGYATAFSLRREKGDGLFLDRLNQQSTEGAGPAHVSVNVDGGSVFVSNYGSGSVTSYKIEPSGTISAPMSHFQYAPVDEQPVHERPHAHEATPSPDGRWLLVNDLGSDRIWVYRIDPASGVLTPNTTAFWQGRLKSGPRHLVFHPNGRWVYNVNELDSTVDHLLWDGQQGTLATQGSFVSTLPADYPKGTAFASEIIISRDGQFVYVGNRRNETIAKLDVNHTSGGLILSQLAPHGGKTARHIALDPTERYLLVACQDSGAIAVLSRDPATGRLSAPVRVLAIASPQCLLFTNE